MKRPIGIPYAAVVVEGRKTYRVCPVCAERILCKVRKDADSHSGIDYAAHYEAHHAAPASEDYVIPEGVARDGAAMNALAEALEARGVIVRADDFNPHTGRQILVAHDGGDIAINFAWDSEADYEIAFLPGDPDAEGRGLASTPDVAVAADIVRSFVNGHVKVPAGAWPTGR